MENRLSNRDRAGVGAVATVGFGLVEKGLIDGDRTLSNGLALGLLSASAIGVYTAAASHEREHHGRIAAAMQRLNLGITARFAARFGLEAVGAGVVYAAGSMIENPKAIAVIGATELAGGIIFAAKSHISRRRRRNRE